MRPVHGRFTVVLDDLGMGVHRRFSARAATVALTCAAALVVGGPVDPVGAEPVAGFEIPELVTDFETAPADSDWQEQSAVVVGEYVFLFQQTEFDDPDSVRLWEYHVPADTVRQVDLSAFHSIGDTGAAFFSDLAFGAEIDDGAGSFESVLVKLTPGGVPSVVKALPGFPADLVGGFGALYFSVGDNALWASGLTEVTTVEVADGLSRLDQLAPTPRGDGTEIVYFEADDATAGREPHRYDPDTGVKVFDIAAGGADSRPGEFYTIGNAAYFTARESSVTSLYRLAGSDATTVSPELLQAETNVMVGSGRRVFISFDGGSGSELAYFDHDLGSGAGAFVTVDADFAPASSGFALGPSGALLGVDSDAGESAIWYTDGVTATEVRQTAPLELPTFGLAGGADAAGATALFVADDGTGERVWRYNPAPTLSSIDPVAFGADFNAADLAFFASAVADHWVFPAVDGVAGREPFGSNGTTATTSIIADLAPGTKGSDPALFQQNASGGVDVRVRRESTAVRDELLSVDVDATAGTIDLGLDDDDRLEAFLGDPDGSFLMFVDRGGPAERLVRSVGGVATDLGSLDTSTPDEFIRSGDRLFFERTGFRADQVASIRIDGTDLQELGSVGFDHAIPFADGVVFESDGSVAGDEEPWFSDGTPAGTFQLADLRAGRGSFPGPFFDFDGAVYFHAVGSTRVTDGTVAGTTLAWSSLGIDELGAVGDDGVLARDGQDLFFVTSGAGGTQPIAGPDFPNAPFFQFWQQHSTTSHAVSVVLDGGVTWIGVVDGDEYRATELDLGSSDYVEAAVAHRGVAYYVIRRDVRQEIVRTDGTEAGTGVIWEQRNSPDSLNTIVLSGDRVFFDGWTEDTGKELWSIDLRPSAPTAVAAVPGDGSATVSWVAPTDAGSQPITGYTVTASPGGATCATTGAVTCVFDGLTNGTPYTFTVITTSETSVSAPSAPSASVTPMPPVIPEPEPDVADVVSLEPGRVLDTRATGETVDDRFEKTGKVVADSFVELDVAGRAGVPGDAGAVVLNVTMIRPDGNGFVTVFPCGGSAVGVVDERAGGWWCGGQRGDCEGQRRPGRCVCIRRWGRIWRRM